MKEFFRTMLDHFQNIKRHRQALLSITFTSMLSCYFPAIVFVHLHFIKEEGSIYYMHDWIKDWIHSLSFSTVHHGPGTSGTTTTSAFRAFHCIEKLMHLAGFAQQDSTQKREDKENCFNLFTWFNFFPVISWLPLLNWNSKTIIMREFYILTAYIFIVLEND